LEVGLKLLLARDGPVDQEGLDTRVAVPQRHFVEDIEPVLAQRVVRVADPLTEDLWLGVVVGAVRGHFRSLLQMTTSRNDSGGRFTSVGSALGTWALHTGRRARPSPAST